MVLNDQNREQVQTLVTQAMQDLTALRKVQEELAEARAKTELYEEYERKCQRLVDGNNREIKALGFHDVGHARTELSQGEK